MKPEIIPIQNSFTGGMDKDTRVELLPSTKYIDAQNGRTVSVDGSTYSFENLRGDELYLAFPEIPIHFRYKVCVPDGVTSFDLFVEISTNGKTYRFPGPSFVFNVNPGNIDALEGVFETQQLEEVGNPSNKIYLRDYIYFYRVCNCLYFVTRQIVDSNGLGLGFLVSIANVVPIVLSFSAENVSILAQQPRLVMGKVWVAGDLILLTQSVGVLSGLDTGVRQFWKLDIRSDNFLENQTDANRVLLLTADVLKYHDILNIPLTSVPQLKYVIENDCIKSVYETDNVNPPIKVAVGDAGLNVTPPELLSWNPECVSSEIIFDAYINGTLTGGVYQYSYRLLTNDGKTTFWSPLTRHITAVDNNFDPYWDYTGAFVGQPTAQGIRLLIDNIDTRYERIQVAYALSLTRFQNPVEVHVFAEFPITGTLMVFDHNINGFPSGISNDVILEELTVQNPVFGTVKTIEIYRNRLFAANFCETDFNFDTTGITLNYIIKKIASDFRTDPRPVDNDPPVGATDFGQNTRWSAPFNDIPYPGFNVGFPNPTLVSDWSDYKGGAVEHALKGYWADETYRFGIVFLLKNGKTTSAFWIGDYRFPDRGFTHNFPNPNGTVPITDEDPLIPVTPGDIVAQKYYLNALGLHVGNIDLSQTITEGIYAGKKVYEIVSGFMIVRCQRDKQILAQGVVINSVRQTKNGIPASRWVPFWDNEYAIGTDTNGDLWSIHTSDTIPAVADTLWFYSPETDILSYTQAQAGMSLVTIETLSLPAPRWQFQYVGNQSPRGRYRKVYKRNDPLAQVQVIEKAALLDTGTQQNDFSGLEDFGLYTSEINIAEDCGQGCVWYPYYVPKIFGRATLLKLSAPYSFSTSNWSNVPVLSTVNLVRPKDLTKLYGGQTQEAKAANIYETTGHFQSVTCDNGANHVYTAEVFGGDCIVQFYTRNVEFAVDGVNYNFIPTDPTQFFTSCPPTFSPCYDCICEQMFANVISVPLESEVNGTLRFATAPDYIYQQARNFSIGNTPTGFQGRESFEYWDVYSHDETAQFFSAADVESGTCLTCLPYTIAASQRKISGEKIDSYLIFPVNDRLELEPNLGAINHIRFHPKFDTGLYFWLAMAFGYTPIEEQVALQDNSQLVVSSGTVFGQTPRPIYVSRFVGCQHQASITNSSNAFYWWDATNKGVYRFGQDGVFHLSKDFGLNRLFQNLLQIMLINNTDTPLNGVGITLAYNGLYEEIAATFLAPAPDSQLYPEGYTNQLRPDRYFTVVFNEKNNHFTHFFTVTPVLWIPISGNRLLSQRVPLSHPTHPDDYKVFWHYKNFDHGLFWLTPPNYPPAQVANPENPDDPTDPFNQYWDIHRTYIEFVANGQNKQTKVLSALMFDMNNFWSTFRVRSNPLLQLGNAKLQFSSVPYVLESSGHFFWTAETEPRGCKIESNFLRTTNVLTTDNRNTVIPLPPAFSYLQEYNMSKVRGEQLYIQLAYKGIDYREFLEAVTYCHLDRRNT